MGTLCSRRFIIEFSPDKCLYFCTIGVIMPKIEDGLHAIHFLEGTDDTIADIATTHGHHLFHKQCQQGGEIVIFGIIKTATEDHKETIISAVDNKHIEGVPL